MRQSELLNLTWNDIDFDNCRALLNDTKNGERRVVHIAGKALELLQGLKQQRIAIELKSQKSLQLSDEQTLRRINAALVFPGKATLNKGPASIRTAWLYALKKAEVTNFHWHDLRHSAASYLAMNGAPLLDIAAVLGHKTLSMVKRYSHLSETHVGNVVASMNAKIFGK
ncbi:MAG: site-specific integrase [Proteobacteria bacterium]|nr:site-specific integrase [Pseudomonadota bacterium]